MFKKLALISAATMFAASAMAADNSVNAASAIAAVNIPFVMNEIPQAKAVGEQLQKEFAPRQQELEKIQSEGRKLEGELKTLQGDKATDAQRRLAQLRADFDLKGQAFQEDQRKRVQEENVKLGKLIQQAIDSIAKERGLQLVLRGESVVYATKAMDISDEVIARVSKMKSDSKK